MRREWAKEREKGEVNKNWEEQREGGDDAGEG